MDIRPILFNRFAALGWQEAPAHSEGEVDAESGCSNDVVVRHRGVLGRSVVWWYERLPCHVGIFEVCVDDGGGVESWTVQEPSTTWSQVWLDNPMKVQRPHNRPFSRHGLEVCHLDAPNQLLQILGRAEVKAFSQKNRPFVLNCQAFPDGSQTRYCSHPMRHLSPPSVLPHAQSITHLSHAQNINEVQI